MRLVCTQIAPTLDTPMEPGKNVIWSAAFVHAWKELQREIAAPVELTDAGTLCARLNNAHTPAGDLPPGVSYSIAARGRLALTTSIHQDLKNLFPQTRPPTLPPLPENAFLLYSYAQTHVSFAMPFIENTQSLEFVDSTGEATAVQSFGLRPQDRHAYYKLRDQIEIILKIQELNKPPEYAVDLCRTSHPIQVVLARIAPEKTLGATLDSLGEKIRSWKNKAGKPLGESDTLLVPSAFWRFSHRFTELEAKPFVDPARADQTVAVARLDIQFKLDGGRSEVISAPQIPTDPEDPFDYTANQPFLLYVTKRDAERPFFVMWVDNVELLQRW